MAKWWHIKEHPNWNREMAAHYKAGLEDGKEGRVGITGLAYQGCYNQGYEHGQTTNRTEKEGK